MHHPEHKPSDTHCHAIRIFVLCAQWCGVCRQFADGLHSFQADNLHYQITLVDIEEAPEWEERVAVESFPTLFVEGPSGEVLFSGSVEPDFNQLARLLASLQQR